MKKWEYKISITPDWETNEEFLNRMGGLGWEAFHILGREIYFKKEIL